MKTFIAISCLLAVASAGLLHTPLAYHGKAAVFDQNGYKIDEVGPYNALPVATPLAAPFLHSAYATPAVSTIAHPVAYAADYKWVGPQNIPVIGPNGVPLDTPEVAAGKVANAVAHVEAKVRNGDVAVVAPIAPIATPVIARTYAAPLAVSTYASHHIPVIGANGVPLDTPEVAHAKAVHYEAHIDAKVRNGHLPLIHYRKRRGLVAAPFAYSAKTAVVDQNGYKIDEVAAPVVAHGYAAPWAAPLASTYAAHIASPLVAPVVAPVAYSADYKWVGPQNIPVIGPNGVPLDTPEVAAGKVANAVAHVEAKVRNGDVAVVAPVAPVASIAPIATSYAAPLAVATPYYAGYAGPQHLPVIGPNGVPLDTPEVAAGKHANAVAHVEAKARNGDLFYHY